MSSKKINYETRGDCDYVSKYGFLDKALHENDPIKLQALKKLLESLSDINIIRNENIGNLEEPSILSRLIECLSILKTQVEIISEIRFGGSVFDPNEDDMRTSIMKWIEDSVSPVLSKEFRDSRNNFKRSKKYKYTKKDHIYFEWYEDIDQSIYGTFGTIDYIQNIIVHSTSSLKELKVTLETKPLFDINDLRKKIRWNGSPEVFILQITKLKDNGYIDFICSDLVFVIDAPYPHVHALFAIWEQDGNILFVQTSYGSKKDRNKIIINNFKYRDKNGTINSFKQKTLDKTRSDNTFGNYIPVLEKSLK